MGELKLPSFSVKVVSTASRLAITENKSVRANCNCTNRASNFLRTRSPALAQKADTNRRSQALSIL